MFIDHHISLYSYIFKANQKRKSKAICMLVTTLSMQKLNTELLLPSFKREYCFICKIKIIYQNTNSEFVIQTSNKCLLEKTTDFRHSLWDLKISDVIHPISAWPLAVDQ